MRLKRPVLGPLLLAATVCATVVCGPAAPASAATAVPPATAVGFALAQLGDGYLWGGNGPATWDCSGLTRAAYAAAGVSVPRVSRDQYAAGTHVARADWAPGDLVFWASDPAAPSTIYHVGLYLGGGRVVHAPKAGDVVRIATVWTAGLVPWATRPVPTAPAMFTPALVAGRTGDTVRDTQVRLRANGRPIAVTGVFDSATASATRAFQRSVGMPDTGAVGPRTWEALVVHGVSDRVS